MKKNEDDMMGEIIRQRKLTMSVDGKLKDALFIGCVIEGERGYGMSEHHNKKLAKSIKNPGELV